MRPRLAQRCKQQHCAGRMRECNGPPGLSNRFRPSSLFVYGVSCVLQLHRWECEILGALWPLETSVRTISTGVSFN